MILEINDVVQINHNCGLGDLVLNTYGIQTVLGED